MIGSVVTHAIIQTKLLMAKDRRTLIKNSVHTMNIRETVFKNASVPKIKTISFKIFYTGRVPRLTILKTMTDSDKDNLFVSMLR